MTSPSLRGVIRPLLVYTNMLSTHMVVSYSYNTTTVKLVVVETHSALALTTWNCRMVPPASSTTGVQTRVTGSKSKDLSAALIHQSYSDCQSW